MPRFRPSRRQFLYGLGTALALPALESLNPFAKALAQAGAARRIAYFYLPNGAQWTPDQAGTGFSLPLPLTPLQPLKDYLTVLSGVDNKPGQDDRAGAHARAGGSYLTSRHADFPGPNNSRSIDLMIADQIGKSSRFNTLCLALEGRGGSDNGYAADYESNISWLGGASPNTKLSDPRAIFSQLFAGGSPAAQAMQQQDRNANGKSVLDYVLAEANALNPQLAAGDRSKLDEYLQSVRDLESRIGNAASCQQPPNQPAGDLAYKDRVPVIYDLLYHAFSCGMTNVATLMLANEVSGQSYDFIGVGGSHHDISHDGSAGGRASIAKIAQWHVAQFTVFCQRLKDTPDGAGGSLLDTSLLVFGGGLADGAAHTVTNLPLIVVGKGAGTPGGRHLQLNGAPLASLHLRIAAAAGVSLPVFGDASSPLALS